MQKVIAEIRKNKLHKYIVSTKEFRGHKFIDVRLYFEDSDGIWRPSKKGITIKPEIAQSLIGAIVGGLCHIDPDPERI